jgi:oxygen-independent coproporphyrinogen-3 oxidase
MENNNSIPLSHGRLLEGNVAIGASLGFGYKANQPISLERYRQQFGIDLLSDQPYKDVLSELVSKGLLELTDNGQALKPTLEGEALHEEIISVYLHERIGGFSGDVCQRFGGVLAGGGCSV